MTNPTLAILCPQIILVATACLLLMVFQHRRLSKVWVGAIGVCIFIAAGAAKAWISSGIDATEIAEVTVDPHIETLQWIMLGVGGVFAGLLSQRSCGERSAVESVAMLLFSTAGGLLAAMADDLVLLTAALALAYLPLVLVLFVSERTPTAKGATLKFAIMAGLSLSLTVLGFVFLYALTGTTTLSVMNLNATTAAHHTAMPSAALILLITGLAIPLAAVPFHFAMVDVVNGVDGWTAGVLLLVPRLAAISALLRICLLPSPVATHVGVALLLVLAVITMLGGALMALTQTRVPRLLANLAMAQTGWWLFGLAVICWRVQQGDSLELQQARAAWTGQLGATSLALAGLSAVFLSLGGGDEKCRFTDELTGLSRTEPTLAAAVLLFLFSLAGLPPLLGFWSQAALLWTALAAYVPNPLDLVAFHRGFVTAAGAGVVGGMVMAAVAVRTISLMFFHPPLNKPQPRQGHIARLVAVALAFALIAASLFPRAVWDWLIR
ncbi:NADH-quinone oxidoreductase subunit N [Symmachiella macrocystis]|uniref:NADH-quinone oxidoreductase subunit N n=1 Tax=Symmachiella macrocystis TaxID=2527985 RepID=A0A5C6BKA9_9PLAN|nr:proton-conducting transporter membrane subunit [Symmachiella macrocystis]TWU12425.1 NADH-quinone oxidoreductase subunit N [Symmachiella macrocystis]